MPIVTWDASARGDSIFGDPYNRVRDEHGFAELSYERALGAHGLKARAYYDRYKHKELLHRDPTDWPAGTWYSDDPHTVARLGSAYIGAAQGAGILTTPKHFPGHGATVVDSHLDLPRVEAHAESTEWRVLALHGLLHLVGYDHETDSGTMRRLEARLRRRGGLVRGLIERGGRA